MLVVPPSLLTQLLQRNGTLLLSASLRVAMHPAGWWRSNAVSVLLEDYANINKQKSKALCSACFYSQV